MPRNAVCIAFLFCSLMAAADGSLGVAISNGGFLLNRSHVRGNATLLEGAVIETQEAPSRLQLSNGARIELAAQSRAKVHAGRMVLEKGSGEMTLPAGFSIEARTLSLSPQKEDVRAVVHLTGDKAVQVASMAGALRVMNAAGTLVSRLEAGMALEFEPQAGAQAAPSSFLGCVLKKGDDFVLYNQLTRIVVQLRGQGLEREWGNRVQANGTARAAAQPADANVQVLDVTSLVRIETGGCGEVAQLIQAQLPAGQQPSAAGAAVPRPSVPAPGGGGMSAGAKVAIVVVVAGGGGAAGYFVTQKDRSK